MSGAKNEPASSMRQPPRPRERKSAAGGRWRHSFDSEKLPLVQGPSLLCSLFLVTVVLVLSGLQKASAAAASGARPASHASASSHDFASFYDSTSSHSHSSSSLSSSSPSARGEIIAISVVKNEEDIIEAFVRHTLHFADRMIVSDSGSIDGTWDILQRLVRDERLPVRLVKDTQFAHDHSGKMTALYKLSLEYEPDFVMPLDADEFIQAGSRTALRESFRDIPSAGVGQCKWKNYVLSDTRELRIAKRFALRSKQSSYAKIVIRPPGPEDSDVVIEQGNHALYRGRLHVDRAWLEECSIAHFPIRSAQQLGKKVVIGWLAIVAKFGGTQREVGFHKKDLYEKVLSGAQLDESVLAEEAYWYGSKRENRTGAMDFVRDPAAIFPRNAAILDQDKSPLETAQDLLSFVCRTWEAELGRGDGSGGNGGGGGGGGVGEEIDGVDEGGRAGAVG